MIKILLILSFAFICKSNVIVQTQYGPIIGAERISALNRTYFSFQKIPYMKPPIGRLRFRDAEVPDNWTEPLDCTQEGPRFPQVDFTFEPPNAPFRGDLDSMHINVYTRNWNPTTKLPVFVWIHGGGFRTGSGLTEVYGPDYFMERDTILVTFNYRLYAFGFLSLDDPELNIPGNAGLKDQTLALKWIKENIRNFGGDENKITIFGQSSGGGCAHYHILSPLSKDLFQKSIIMSGSAFNPMYAAIPRRNWAFRLASALNESISEDEAEILEFLEQADPQAIFEAVGTLLTPYERDVERLLNAFGPVIEPYNNGNNFMLSHPEELAIHSWGNDIDIMIGATSFETGMLVPLFMQFPHLVEPNSNFTSWVPYSLDLTVEERIMYGNMLKKIYYGMMDATPTSFDPSIIVGNDFSFWHVIDRVVQQRLRSRGSGRNFVYRFDANADNNCFRDRHRIPARWHSHHRAIHMDDLCYLFKPSFVENIPDIISLDLVHHMLLNFFNFGTAGNPSVAGWNPVNNSAMTLFGHNIRETRNLDTFGEMPEMERMSVWRLMYHNKAYSFNLNLILLVFSLTILFKIYR